jgi:hypothetical protein
VSFATSPKKNFSGGKEKEVSHKENEASKVHKGFLFVLLVSFASSQKRSFSGGKEKEVSHKEKDASKVHEGFPFMYLRFLRHFAEKKLFPGEKKRRSRTKKTKLQRFTKASSSRTFVSFATSPKRNFFGRKRKGGFTQRK